MSLYIESAVNGLRSFLVNWSSSSSWSTSLANTLLTRNELTLRDVPQEFIVGDEFQVNTYTTSDQFFPSVAVLEDSSFVISWSSAQDGDDKGVYAQRFDAVGERGGLEFQLNTYTTSYQSAPSILDLKNGYFMAVWHSDVQDTSFDGIYGRRYSNDGIPQGSEYRVNTYITSYQQHPNIALTVSLGLIATWTSYGEDSSSWGVYAQRYDNFANPQGGAFKVNTYFTNIQSYPITAGLANGDFIVIWSGEGLSDSSGIFAQSYSSAGATIGGEFRVNTVTTDNQNYPSVAVLSNGDFVVVWSSNLQDGSGLGVYGQLYDSQGTTIANEFQVNSYTTSDQNFPSVAALLDGGFVVAWQSNGQDGSGWGIYGQRYISTGEVFGGEFQINMYTTGDQQYLSSSGIAGGKNCGFTVAGLRNGGFVATWGSDGQDGNGYGVYARMYTMPLQPQLNFPFFVKLALGLGGAAILGSGIGYGLYKKRVQSRIKLRKQDSELSSESFNDQTMYSGATQVSEVVRVKNASDIEHVLSMSPNDPRFLNDEKHQVVGENSFFKPAPAPETQEKKKRNLSKEAKTLSMVGVGRPGSSF